jgi:shikimate kinase
MHNIYLIGMMGSGKTVTGKAVADLSGMKFFDLDETIENETHLSINEIFKKKGEPYFRTQEKQILLRASQEKNTVIATGGGVVLDPENVERMQKTGLVIYLAGSFETLWRRVQDKRDRPLLSAPDPKAVFSRLFHERRPLYETACHGRVETEGLSPEAVAKKISEQYLR